MVGESGPKNRGRKVWQRKLGKDGRDPADADFNSGERVTAGWGGGVKRSNKSSGVGTRWNCGRVQLGGGGTQF